MKTKCKFTLAKQTKGALQYKQVGQEGTSEKGQAGSHEEFLIGTLYVRKSHMDGAPAELLVTVEA